jgi:hypothetical protein
MRPCAAFIARRFRGVCPSSRVQSLSRFSSSAASQHSANDAHRSAAAADTNTVAATTSSPASFVGHVFQRRGDAANAAQDTSLSASGDALPTRAAEEDARGMTDLHKARVAHAAERNRMVEGLPVGNESRASYSKKCVLCLIMSDRCQSSRPLTLLLWSDFSNKISLFSPRFPRCLWNNYQAAWAASPWIRACALRGSARYKSARPCAR